MSKAQEPETWEPVWVHRDYQIIEEEPVYSGYCPVLRYTLEHQLFKGGTSHPLHRELVLRPPAVAVLLYDPKQDQVILIEQFRVGALKNPLSPWLLEVVAGLVDEGETKEATAHREAKEEAGCLIQRLIPICDYLPSPGFTNEETSIYCGITDASQITQGHGYGLAEDGEDIKVHIFSSEACFALLKQGKIVNASTIIALQWLQLNISSILKDLKDLSDSQ